MERSIPRGIGWCVFATRRVPRRKCSGFQELYVNMSSSSPGSDPEDPEGPRQVGAIPILEPALTERDRRLQLHPDRTFKRNPGKCGANSSLARAVQRGARQLLQTDLLEFCEVLDHEV